MTFTRHITARSFIAGVAAAATLTLATSDAFAQARRGPTSPGRITIENQRATNLVELKVISKGENGAERVVAKNLAPGKRVSFTLPPRSGCLFDLAGAFDDDSVMEAEDRNLCQDKVLRLVE